jgi:hypothetical protein
MKKIYETPVFLEIPIEEFNSIILKTYGKTDSCYI